MAVWDGRGSTDVVDRYIAWAFRERKIRTPKTEATYRRVLKELAAAINAPLEDISEEDLREYQYAQRHETARTWNLRCSVIAEFCRYLVRQEGRPGNPSDVLKRLPIAEPRRRKDPAELELLMSVADPETRAVAQLVRETGLSLPEVLRIDVKPDGIPALLRVSVKANVEKDVPVTPPIREALQQMGGRIPGSLRTWEKRFKEAGFLAGDLQKAGPSRSLSLDALHPRISLEVRRQLMLGDLELAAFAAFREVEIRVRELANAPDSVIGVKLMHRAFLEGGPLSNPAMDGGEREAIMALFRGGIGVFKNPSSHRRVQFADAAFAREVILLADLLHRMLDDIARSLRLG